MSAHAAPAHDSDSDAVPSGFGAATTARDLSFLLGVFAVAMGFAHRFGYMQRLGSEMELGDQSFQGLAVDAFQTISEQWLLYCGAIVLALAVLGLGKSALRRWRIPLHGHELSAMVLISFTFVLSAVAFADGKQEADHFYHTAFIGQDRHAHQIFVPSQAKSTDECYADDLTAATPSPSTVRTQVYWYLTAQSPNGYHVIRQTVTYAAHSGGQAKVKVEPVVFAAGMLGCFTQLETGSPPTALVTVQPDDHVVAKAP